MTPLSAFLLIALIIALIVIGILFNNKIAEDKAKDEPRPPKRKRPMTDAECEMEYRAHKPSVSASVLSKLKKIQRRYLEGEGILKFQNCAGVDYNGTHTDGYSLRVRVRTEKGYRVICFSYNRGGKFYSIQDTYGRGGYMGEKGEFICSY